MLIVPLHRDVLMLFGLKNEAIVSSYSSFKPGVYVKSDSTMSTDMSFIESVNNIPVKLSSGVLKANGPIKREIHLPQPGDSVEFFLDLRETELLSQIVKTVNISKQSSHKISITTIDGIKLNITEINNIIRSHGFSKFNKSKFMSIYKDYA